MASATSIRSRAASGSSSSARPGGRRRPPHLAPRTRTASPCKPPPPRPARPGGGRPSAAPPRVCLMRARWTLARLPVESVEGDLGPVHVEPGYDRHWASTEAPALPTSRECLARNGGGPASCIGSTEPLAASCLLLRSRSAQRRLRDRVATPPQTHRCGADPGPGPSRYRLPFEYRASGAGRAGSELNVTRR
jgi:hypothetical protein